MKFPSLPSISGFPLYKVIFVRQYEPDITDDNGDTLPDEQIEYEIACAGGWEAITEYAKFLLENIYDDGPYWLSIQSIQLLSKTAHVVTPEALKHIREINAAEKQKRKERIAKIAKASGDHLNPVG